LMQTLSSPLLFFWSLIDSLFLYNLPLCQDLPSWWTPIW
jgi:hypothetical protein